MEKDQQRHDEGHAAGVDVEPQLSAEDQARVDAFLSKGVNAVERKPFKPFRLLILLVVVVTTFSVLSQLLARWAGVY